MDHSRGQRDSAQGNRSISIMTPCRGDRFCQRLAPSYTFVHREGRPFISYDYYLSPTRTETDAVADLHELAAINSDRPYFLLMHVREASDVKRVKSILDRLGPEYQLVPLDVFLHLAGKKPTFKERYLTRP